MSYATEPISGDDLPAIATLLADRQRRLRQRRPELPERYEDPAAWADALAGLHGQAGSLGVVLRDDDAPTGFLLGHPRTEPTWGRSCWIPVEGSALADAVPAESVRDLYAAWSEHFVRRGFFLHYALAPADDSELMAAWVRTGFGQMQAHAVRDLNLTAQAPSGVRIRRATPDDIDGIAPLLPLIAVQLAGPPAYAARLPGEIATYRDSWLEELSEPAAHHWLAEEDGQPLAIATFYVAEPGPMVPDGAWELAVAMTAPEARGRGLMRALVAAGFAEAREAGATHCITDWRTASLSTHRTWTSLGFVPTHYRLHRHIDERIAWAAAGT